MFGTIVYTKNRYLTLQFSKGGKNVMCEDHFDNMVVFSDAWWIGKKDENPEEDQLDFPKNLVEGKHTESDFKGGAGAGAASEKKSSLNKPRKEYVEPESSSADMEDDSEDAGSLTGNNKDLLETTPVRQSSRTAGKTFKFTEVSSGDSSAESDSDKSEMMKESRKKKLDDVTKDSNLVVDAIDSVHDAAKHDILEQQSAFSVKPKEISVSKRAPLVQTSISTLFVKAKAKAGDRKNKVTRPRGGNSGARNSTRKKKSQVEDDDIVELSSESEDTEESDDDWVA